MDLVALMVDGIGFGEHMLVVALGIDSTGKKHALAIREGSTENSSLCRSMLSDLALRWALARTLEAEKQWRRLMGKADMPRLVAALRQLDLARAAPSPNKRAAQHCNDSARTKAPRLDADGPAHSKQVMECAALALVGSARVLDDGALDTIDEQHAAARAHVGAALDASAALDHAEPIHPSSNTPLLVPTWAPRSTLEHRSV